MSFRERMTRQIKIQILFNIGDKAVLRKRLEFFYKTYIW